MNGKQNIGNVPWNKGKKMSEETRQKVRIARARQTNAKTFKPGKDCISWKGGVTPLLIWLRNTKRYKAWRTNVYRRDGFTCQFCGQVGGRLNVDHAKPFALIVHENGVSKKNHMACDELWDETNGRTLCVACHKKTPTFARHTNFTLSKQSGI